MGKRLAAIAGCLLILFVVSSFPILAEDCASDDKNCILNKKIQDLQQKISSTQSQRKTLSSEIEKINNNIELTELKIQDTSEKLDRLGNDISSVSGKIDRIETSLNHVSEVLANRINATYVAGREDPMLYLLSSADFNELMRRYDYFRIVQKHDKELMIQMATTRKNYHDQKDLLEDKKAEVEKLSKDLKDYQVQLQNQNTQKQALLKTTQNDEKRYQQQLALAQAEINAVNTSQYSGKRDVKKGEVIGLMGNTGFSTGPHLHFGVYNLSEGQASSFSYASGTNNPLSFLTGRTVNVSGGGCYSGTVSSSGDWDWPMSSPLVTQCYGKTPYSFWYSNGIHDGLDMVGTGGDILVKAVADGVAYFYRGSGSLGNNVRVFHNNGKMSLYLHLQ